MLLGETQTQTGRFQTTMCWEMRWRLSRERIKRTGSRADRLCPEEGCLGRVLREGGWIEDGNGYLQTPNRALRKSTITSMTSTARARAKKFFSFYSIRCKVCPHFSVFSLLLSRHSWQRQKNWQVIDRSTSHAHLVERCTTRSFV